MTAPHQSSHNSLDYCGKYRAKSKFSPCAPKANSIWKTFLLGVIFKKFIFGNPNIMFIWTYILYYTTLYWELQPWLQGMNLEIKRKGQPPSSLILHFKNYKHRERKRPRMKEKRREDRRRQEKRWYYLHPSLQTEYLVLNKPQKPDYFFRKGVLKRNCSLKTSSLKFCFVIWL